MAVKLHGIQEKAAEQDAADRTQSAPLHIVQGAPPPAKLPKPKPFKSPVTVGRVIYFCLLAAGIIGGGYWLALKIWFVTAVGVVDRDMDRLAPRERGRITKVAVKDGDIVRPGQPLVWLDYSAQSSEFVSEAEARNASKQLQKDQLEARKQDIRRQQAMARATIAALRARAQGLAAQRSTLNRSKRSAERLQKAGAATGAEVERIVLALTEVEQELNASHRQAHEEDKAVRVLDDEYRELESTRSTVAVPGNSSDPGIIAASREGIVAWVAHNAGEVVDPNEPIIVLVDRDRIRVRAYVAPEDGSSVKLGTAATILLPTGERVEGTVSKVHMLASSFTEPQTLTNAPPGEVARGNTAPPLFGAQSNTLSFLLAEVSVLDPQSEVAKRLVMGTPCEVRVRRTYSWM
jgi:multidrug resistance efflux pump